MGITDSRSEFEAGHIILQTTKPYYAPGEEVTGNIYISLQNPFPGSNLQLVLKGKEDVGWTVRKKRGKHSYTKHIEDKVEIVNFTAPIYTFMGGSVMPGQYSFPFKIVLPVDIPSNCFYTNKASQRSHGKVKYKLKAVLKSNDDKMKDMNFKQTLIIRQQPDIVPMSSAADYSDQVKTCCCCCSSGVVTIQSQTDKTAYTPTETVKIIGNIDNSKCKRDIKKVKVQLVQSVQLNARRKKRNLLNLLDSSEDHLFNNTNDQDRRYNNTYVVLEKEYPGIPQGQSTKGENQFMELPLREYGNKMDREEFKEQIEGRDDHAMGEGVQPTSTGRLIKITYELKIFADYDICCGCCTRPETAISVFISPPKLPSYQALEAPPNWNPQVFDSKNFADPVPNLTEKGKIDKL
ncbi:unnamed protein product [Moneuplotes crassus]|uniref:Arrestin C-terminal-like domain-containing protein n=1 Tax=Euplotes crassus TaxID=5936 RepID=A0AAD1URV1_EUPCR|nr:unnamed protein product [Moneuplotes crassus]